MHILSPKHTRLNSEEAQKLIEKLNVSRAQIPKILLSDPALPEKCGVGDIIKIERKEPKNPARSSSQSKEGEKINIYYRVVV